jgi:hypothetical protein
VCGVVPYPSEPVRAIAQFFGPVVVGTILFQELPGVPGSSTAVGHARVLPLHVESCSPSCVSVC